MNAVGGGNPPEHVPGGLIGKLKRRTYEVLEKAATPDDHLSRAADIFLVVIIVANLVSVSIETIESVRARYGDYFRAFDLFSLAIFTAEYIIRIWACTADPKFTHPIRGRIRYALTAGAIIDLLAILPFYIPAVVIDLRAGRALRLFRLMRLFKVGRYSRSAQTLIYVVQLKKEELGIAIFAQLVLIAIASSLMYFIEYPTQPDIFASVPHAMWWGVSTLTRVSAVDIFPITPWGKLLGSVISILGVAFFALPVGIIGSGFVQALYGDEKEMKYCPHCGERLRR